MTDSNNELVVILHGIGMFPLRMFLLEQGLKKAGYDTLNIAYPSRSKSIEHCADAVHDEISKRIQAPPVKIHFVTHSMGGLLALDLLHRKAFDNAARAVLIAPPYQGSEVADFLDTHLSSVYRFWFGPAGEQLKTSYRKDVQFEVPESVEVGVVAGTHPIEHFLFRPIMDHLGDHDGVVSVKSTQIPFMRDHITIRTSHDFIIEKAIPQTLHFLDHGRFSRDPS